MKRNILNFEEWIFENESENFESFDAINEEYPYDQLKKAPSNATIAKALKDAKGSTALSNDKEAWVVAALQAIKSKKQSPEHINNVSKELLKINGGKLALNQWIASFMSGGDLTDNVHNNTSVAGELARIYGIEFNPKVSPYNLYKFDPTAKDSLKKTMDEFRRRGLFKPGGGESWGMKDNQSAGG
jgi:hypothetical protein